MNNIQSALFRVQSYRLASPHASIIQGILAGPSMLLLALLCDATQAADPAYPTLNVPITGTVIGTKNAAASTSDKENLSRIALLAPKSGESAEHEIASVGPIYLESNEENISRKWEDLQSRVRSEEAMLAACRVTSSNCSVGGRRFFEIVDLGRQHQGRTRLGQINREVNMRIKSVSDWVQHSVADFWSAPLATLETGAGDCEDYAIVKYFALLETGTSPDDLRLLFVRYPRHSTAHVVLAVRLNEEWFILDNLTLTIISIEEATHYKPLFALDLDSGLSGHRLAARSTRTLE